jgi:L-histidine N-alpha-methyltransferase
MSTETHLADEVRAGLTRDGLKELSPKHLYDARGSELFDRITEQPEYYPTPAERSILERHAPGIVAGMDELVELGSGTATKTRVLLATGTLRRYVPFDVDPWVVDLCRSELGELFPDLSIDGVVGDFMTGLDLIPAARGPRLIALLGGTIGNLKPPERASFLRAIRDRLGPGDRFLLGTDLVKDRAVLEAAYNDAAGVSAEFTLNVLRVLNRELGADFDPDAFEHVAFFDPHESRIDIRVRSRRDQRVRVPGAGIELDLAAGEDIRTEVSSKFTRERLEGELAEAGLALDHFLTDPDRLFALSLVSRAA